MDLFACGSEEQAYGGPGEMRVRKRLRTLDEQEQRWPGPGGPGILPLAILQHNESFLFFRAVVAI